MLPKIIIAVVLVILSIVILRPFDPTGPLGSKNLEQLTNHASERDAVVLTHPIFNPKEIDWVSPLGESNGGYIEVQPLGGMTVNIKKEVAQKGPIEVYAPTDMQLVAYAHTIMESEPEPDWSLYFKINEDVSLILHHIKNVNPKITDVVGNTPKRNDSRTTDIRWPQEIKFKAGEVIGTTTGTSQAKNWNIYFHDKRIKNQFINQKRYEGSGFGKDVGNRLLSASCIFDYYQDEKLKNDFYALLGTTAAGQSTSCGSPSSDKKGTLSGLWHLKKDGIDMGSYDGPFADPFSVYKRSDQSISIYEVNKEAYTISPNNATYKDPAEITSSHCYQLTDNWNPSVYKGYAYFRIDSDTQMSMTYSPSGFCPETFPNRQAKTYYR